MKTVLYGLIAIGLAAAVALYVMSAGAEVSEEQIAALPPGSAELGEKWFWAGGCASCHAAPEAKGDDKLLLGGGLRLETPFGVFVAPNISQSSEDGIGSWSLRDFASAMLHGTAPNGANYYPAFPYTSYARMELQDVSDLFAYMKTLPQVTGKAATHELSFPYNIRRGIGLWKLVFVDPAPVVLQPSVEVEDLEVWQKGRYLVEGPGHCGECHTPRDAIGGLELARWLGGAPAATGEGTVPDITPAGLSSWSASDIAYYLESGFTPDYDSVGGEMVSVQENMARLGPEDRAAIAAYLEAIPAVPE